ncbi:hypothetical protein Cgig2_014734 [Carnegiea gigantea]|uniref:RING-type domain-containing protein n=1 Tax=Carnegiea gigantea TaxID=171969 RepID=A0A9Q1QTH5_9CARY|nr:hypothetical protein Cgig2_014734 [Carnegiea gigantea]
MAIQAQMYPDNFGLLSQDWLMMDPITNNTTLTNNFLLNSCGLNEFSFNLQQKLQQQQQQQQQQFQFQFQQQQQQQHEQQLMVHLQNLQQSNNGSMILTSSSKNFSHPTTTVATVTASAAATSTNHMPMNFSLTLASHVEKQRQEIDRYISLQNERLKLALQEQRNQQLALMLKKVEEKATILLRQKDEEIANARNRTMELEEFTRKMEVESQAWRRQAAENEAMVVSLSNKLEQLREQACCLTSSIGLEDAESCFHGDEYPCNRGNKEEEDEEETGESSRETGERKKKKQKMMMVCRVCDSRNACILFLPCRHLCSCKACEAFLDSCPVCKSPKRATIEALLS